MITATNLMPAPAIDAETLQTLRDGLMALDDQFDETHRAFGDYSAADRVRFKVRILAARRAIETFSTPGLV